MSKENRLIMVFARNAELGKVKTRLAKTIGNENALAIYKALLEHTARVTCEVDASRVVYYSDFIEQADYFDAISFAKKQQQGGELGERMKAAFSDAYQSGYQKVIIVGSDCYELDPLIIESAFEALNEHDIVVGPATDGGYYLLGMKTCHSKLFENKNWGTENVLLDTLLDIRELNLTYLLLDTLTDVDQEEDLGELRAMLEEMNALGRE